LEPQKTAIRPILRKVIVSLRDCSIDQLRQAPGDHLCRLVDMHVEELHGEIRIQDLCDEAYRELRARKDLDEEFQRLKVIEKRWGY
jgi:hypothetical protein